MDFEVNYFYFDWQFNLKCQCGRLLREHGTNHSNEFKCECGRIYKVIPKVVRIK